MNIITKWQDLLQYKIYYTSPTKCITCCTIKFIENLNFACVLLNRQKIKFTSSIKYSSYQQRHSTNLVNTNRFITCATQLLCTFSCTFCCTFWCTICCTKPLYILLKIVFYFSMKFYVHVQYRVLEIKIHQLYVK